MQIMQRDIATFSSVFDFQLYCLKKVHTGSFVGANHLQSRKTSLSVPEGMKGKYAMADMMPHHMIM